MKNYKHYSLGDIKKLSLSATKNRKLCPKCGHSVLFGRSNKMICNWCNTYVFKDDKTEFEYRLKESINRKK